MHIGMQNISANFCCKKTRMKKVAMFFATTDYTVPCCFEKNVPAGNKRLYDAELRSLESSCLIDLKFSRVWHLGMKNIRVHFCCKK